MKHSLVILLIIASVLVGDARPAFPLKVATGQRYLVDQNGAPFYMVGDSPQTIMVQVASNSITQYITNRVAQGFNTFWVYPVDKTDQSGAPDNYYGVAPFDGADFTNEDPTYWAMVDWEINQFATNGLLLVLDPCFVGLNSSDGYTASITASSGATMFAYGAWLGNRYKNYTNIIWSVGGDADPNVPGLYTNLAMVALGIQSNAPSQLVTCEAVRYLAAGGATPLDGYSSMDACYVAFGVTTPSWLNLNWVYKDYANAQEGASTNYWRTNALPALMGEDWYEGEHSMSELMIREEAYWECLSGCNLGRIFGNNAIWTMGGPEDTMGQTWQSQLTSSGSLQESYLGQLISSKSFWLLKPDLNNSVLTSGYGTSGTTNYATAALTSDRNTMVAYLPVGGHVTVALTNFNRSTQFMWFDPSVGTNVLATSAPLANSGTANFTAPSLNAFGDGDWVLVGSTVPAAQVAGASTFGTGRVGR